MTAEPVLVPVPERLTVCVTALFAMVRDPVNEPKVTGLKETLIVQASPGAIGLLQFLVCANGAATASDETCSGPFPVFCSTTFWIALVLSIT